MEGEPFLAVDSDGGRAGETWKLNARDRSVIIRDKGDMGQSRAIGVGLAKKAPSDCGRRCRR